jgi:hypothetical protein
MIAIAIIAAGLRIIQVDRNNPDIYRFWHEYVIGIIPMSCLLLLGLTSCFRDLRWKGKCDPFLLGFETIGWASLFVYASFLAVNYDWKYRTLGRLMPITNFFFPNGCAFADIRVMSLHMVTILVPEILLSLAGGSFFARLGITVVRKPSARIG